VAKVTEDVKDKLLTYLLDRLRTILAATGCPINDVRRFLYRNILRQTQLKTHTDKQTRPLSDCLSVVSQGRPPYIGGRSTMLHRILREEGKNPELTNKYTKFGQFIVKKSLKLSPLDVAF